MILFLLGYQSCSPTKSGQLEHKDGKLLVHSWDFQKSGSIALDGNWEFYWKKHILPGNFDSSSKKYFLKGGRSWNDTAIAQKTLDGFGYATYRLQVILDKPYKLLALRIPYQSTAYRLFINGKEAYTAGVPGKAIAKSSPIYANTLHFFSANSQKIELVFHFSNYFHRLGGMWDIIYLGTPDVISQEKTRLLSIELITIGCLIITGFYHIGLYLLRRKDLSAIFFAGICLLISLRTMLTGQQFFFFLFPNFPWEVAVKLEYLCFYWVLPLFPYFYSAVFPEESIRRANHTICAICLGFGLLTLVTPVRVFSYSMSYFYIITLLVSCYLIVNVFRSVYKKREGSYVVVAGSLIFLTCTVLTILHQSEIFHTTDLVAPGLVIFIFSQSYLLSMKFSKAFYAAELLSENLSNTNNAYSRFVPKELLNFLNKKNITDIRLGDQTFQEMTILFSDIRSFTSLSEQMTPEENFNFLNSYLKRMGPIIRNNGGFIDKYIGDGIMALFARSAEDAVQAAVDMILELQKYNEHRKDSNFSEINIGIGIHSGKIIMGTIGENERMEGTVISDSVNLASRIEGLTKEYATNIIISEKTLDLIKCNERFQYRFLDDIQVKGKSNKVRIYEVLGSSGENSGATNKA
ncbi:MAG: adenylate/guanylate cyclase domain-containing protein [Spirochaetota bacterium]